jgi:hypothetical protein
LLGGDLDPDGWPLGLLFDVFILVFLGASVLPVNIIIGTLSTLPSLSQLLF